MKKDKRLECAEETVKSVGVDSMKKRIKKAHSMAKFAGALYLLGSIALFAFLFLPVLEVVAGTEIWKVSISNFFDPIADFKAELSYNTVVLLPISALYILMLVVGLINLFVCFSQLKGLSKKNPTKLKGYNRNLYAMQKMGRAFSGTLITFFCSNLLIYSIAVAEYSSYVYIVLGAGAFIHFLGGIVGGKIAYYDVEETVVEYKRTSKVSVFFLRNLLQVLATAAIVYFFAKVVTLNVTTAVLSVDGGWDQIWADKTFFLDSCLQVALLVWLVVLINHTFHTTEFNQEGMKGRGMKNYRIFGFLTMATALVWFFVNHSLLTEWSLEILYIAIIAFAMFVFDLVIKSKKTGYVTSVVEQPQEETAEMPADPAYRVPLHCITTPGVFMQPNGQPVMVMPMQKGRPATIASTECAPMPFGGCPVAARPAPVTPAQEPETPFYDEWEGLVFEWDPDGKEREINCPHCGKKLRLKEGAPGYRCGECGKVFQLKKAETPAKEPTVNA